MSFYLLPHADTLLSVLGSDSLMLPLCSDCPLPRHSSKCVLSPAHVGSDTWSQTAPMHTLLPQPAWALTAHPRPPLCGEAFLTLLRSGSSRQATLQTDSLLRLICLPGRSSADASSPLILFFEYTDA